MAGLTVAVWLGAAGATLGAAVLAWRVRAIVGLLAAGLSTAALAAAVAGMGPPAAVLAFAGVSLAATALGALLTRLLASEE